MNQEQISSSIKLLPNFIEFSKTNSAKQFSKKNANNRKLAKRSYSLERNIEMLIVIDILMNKYHGNNLENYIYTLMSTVSTLLDYL